MKAGKQSSEFLALIMTAVVAALPVAIEAFKGGIADGQSWKGAVGLAIAAGLYAISRGMAKARHEEAKGRALEAAAGLPAEERAALLENL